MPPSAQAQRAFNWIDLLAIPLATAVMETQPIAIFLLFVSVIATQQSINAQQVQPWVLNAATITLLLLGLQWWAMLINALARYERYTRYGRVLNVLGLIVAIVILALSLDSSILIPVSLFTLFFWWLGIVQANTDFRDERLVLTFKVGFIVLIAILVLTFGTPAPATLFTALALDLPLFFLSGLFALSFTRLSIIHKEQARLPGATQTSSVRSWFLTLSIAWAAIMALALALETFSFQTVQTLFQPIFYLFNLLIYLFLFSLYLLFSLFKSSNLLPTNIPSMQHSQPHVTPAQHIITNTSSPFALIMLAILSLLALIALFFVIRAILRAWRKAHEQENEDEIREGLSLRSFLQELRQQHPSTTLQDSAVEQLDPASARARYRDLLQTVATQSTPLARQDNETPIEYERRLLARLPQQSHNGSSTTQEQQADTTQLNKLTTAYMHERYAGKASHMPATEDFSAWLQHIVHRLLG